MSVLYLDIETYSDVDLKKSGVYAYTESSNFEILMCAWAWDDDLVEVAVGSDEIRGIPDLFASNTPRIAHNAPFERICFSKFAGLPVGQYLDPEPWIDTAAMAAEVGLPRDLERLARVLGADPKDSAGTRLINLFSKPVRGNRVMPEDRPEQWAEFIEYCRQDVVTLREVHRRLPPWPNEIEPRLFVVHEKINDRGIPVDLSLAPLCIEADEANRQIAADQMRAVLEIDNPNSVPQVMTGLRSIGLSLSNLKSEETLEPLLRRDDLTPVQRQMVELRLEIALAAAKKYQAVMNSVSSDGRLRGQFKFFGAHTGRWSAGGVQVQNLPKAQIPVPDHITLTDENEQDVRQMLVESAILDLQLGNGADATTLRALVRSMFTGPMSVVDYASIEARILAWWADEQWALDAFAANRDIYVETAERMGGLTRAQGKVAVLALGYNGGINSLRNMGAKGDDDELQGLVNAWRKANPRIVRMWRKMEHAFAEGGRVGDILWVERSGRDRLVHLPSGRYLTYRGVSNSRGRITFDDPKGFRKDTYGGRLTENVVQAIGRDLLADALIRLDELDVPLIWTVHDEVIALGNCVELISKVITNGPDWARGLPLAAEGFVTDRYRKG